MSSAPPDLFDLDLVLARHSRMRDDALFLHRAAAEGVRERLAEVSRTFDAPAIVGREAAFWRDLVAPCALCIAPAPVLGLAPAAHDLIVHAPWLHWSNDPLGALIQTRLALRPDGLMLACLFAGDTLAELREALAEAEAEVTGGISPRVAPMAGLADLAALLQRAGFAMPVADLERFPVGFATPFHLMRDLRAMGETNALRDRLRRPTRRAVFLRAAELLARRCTGRDGRLLVSFEIAVLTGWAPGPDQPEPKRPGTAQVRLAEALGTAERSAGEKTAR